MAIAAWLFTCLFALSERLCATALSPPGQFPLLHYSVDLEAAPGVRYANVWAAFLKLRGQKAFADTYAAWHLWLQTAQPELFGNATTAAASQEAWFKALQVSHPEAVEEVLALSRVLLEADASDPLFQPAALATVTSLYPILNIAGKNTTDTKPSACTSTLVRRANGAVLHGRSLDYEPRDPMALGTVVLDFRKQGELAYRCLHPLPYPTAVQWFTCVRAGAFSLSVNARAQGRWTEHNTTFAELLRRVAAPEALLLGELAERAMRSQSYEEALAVLLSSPAVSSNYFILAGAQGQGAVVTRFGNASSADVWALGSAADGQPPWLRVQTNVDHWVTLASGAYATHRRQRVVDLLSNLGQSAVTKESLLDVYLTDHAQAGSENRTTPEDTGVILRPSTIATLVLDPSASAESMPDARFWNIWVSSPVIRPPLEKRSAPRTGGLEILHV